MRTLLTIEVDFTDGPWELVHASDSIVPEPFQCGSPDNNVVVITGKPSLIRNWSTERRMAVCELAHPVFDMAGEFL